MTREQQTAVLPAELSQSAVSSVEDLRQLTRRRAVASFSFFVQRVLGMRGFDAAYLEQLAQAPAAARNGEAKLLERWQQLRSGQIPVELRWLGGGE